jgi:hypothetical protein
MPARRLWVDGCGSALGLRVGQMIVKLFVASVGPAPAALNARTSNVYLPREPLFATSRRRMSRCLRPVRTWLGGPSGLAGQRTVYQHCMAARAGWESEASSG